MVSFLSFVILFMWFTWFHLCAYMLLFYSDSVVFKLFMLSYTIGSVLMVLNEPMLHCQSLFSALGADERVTSATNASLTAEARLRIDDNSISVRQVRPQRSVWLP
jgi:hypothetical protein